jgi:two-component system, chemotaxis family, chemotaxis protein CheY
MPIDVYTTGVNRTPTVLVVEDDAVFRRVITFTVTKAGFKVEQASNGFAGFDRFMVGDIDFIVTDLQMPGSSGIEMLARIKQQCDIPTVPTVLCSAKGLELDTEAVLREFGLLTVLRKPFSPRQLTELIRNALHAEKATLND